MGGWVQKRFIAERLNRMNGLDEKGYNPSEPYIYPGCRKKHGGKCLSEIESVVTHRAGLHEIRTGGGGYSYVCASWTVVCTRPTDLANTRCKSARIVLGAASSAAGQMLLWLPADKIRTHT